MKKNNPALFNTILLVISAVIFIASVVLLISSYQNNQEYEKESRITPSPTMAPPTIMAKPTEALLRVGSISKDVKTLQGKLKELGYYQGEIDGQFGGGTKDAVTLFQQQHGLTADGLAGASTLDMLYGPGAHTIQVTPIPSPPAIQAADIPQLVNRSNPLKDGYVPKSLVTLADTLTEGLAVLKDPQEQGVDAAVQALNDMLSAAHQDGLTLWQVSEGYRTWDEQRMLFNNEKQKLLTGEGTQQLLTETAAEIEAEKNVARPGTSEHQTGLAFDITVPERSFPSTDQARWLREHCWDYGFILRYPAGKEDVTGFQAEPWHIRYVGKDISPYLKQTGQVLEEYLETLNP